MRDPLTFEDRLATVLGSYAERMPTDVDALGLVRATRPARTRAWWTWPPSRSMGIILAALLAVALIGAALVGLALSRPSPPRVINLFSSTGSLHHSGEERGVLLSDGRVLILGRTSSDDGPLTWGEIYDPGSGLFSESPVEAGMYSGISTTLLQDGRVLITGGPAEGPVDARVPHEDRSVVWDPRTGGTTPIRLTTPRTGHITALLADGRVLIAGGVGTRPDGSMGTLTSAEVWDPRSGNSTITGPMSQERSFGGATTRPDGRILVVAGETWQITSDSASAGTVSVEAELYDPGTGTFSPLAPDLTADQHPVFVLAPWGGITQRLFRIDLRAGTFEDITPFPSGRQIQVEATRAGASSQAPSICQLGQAECRVDYGAVLLPGSRVLFVGGDIEVAPPAVAAISEIDLRMTETPATSAIVLDPESGVMTPTGPLVTPRRQPFVTLLADGRVLVGGGLAETEPWLASAEIYTP